MARARRSLGRLTAILPLLLAAAASTALVTAPTAGGGTTPAAELRPDLVQRTPFDVGVASRGGRFLLGFDAAIENWGRGPLVALGRRTAAQRDMSVTQVIRRSDGTQARVPAVGTMRFTRSPGHDHWHYLRAVRYELRRASDHALVRPDQKTGFCLGDRYDTERNFTNKPNSPVYETNCRLNETRALSVAQGISVGYGDEYLAYLEGQSIDVTGLAAGKYELVHRSNPRGLLREVRRSNNASSVLLRLSWPLGTNRMPRVDRLKRCPLRERCTQ